MRTLLTLLIVILTEIALAFVQDSCLQPIGLKMLNNLSQVESGHNSLEWSSKDQQRSNATVTFRRIDHREGVVNVIISLVFLSDLEKPTGIYFQLYPQITKFGSFNAIFKYDKKTRWGKLHFHYVISSTYSLRFGIIEFGAQDLKKINQNTSPKKSTKQRKQDSFDFKLPNQINQIISNTTAYAFLTGLRSQDPYFNITIISNNDFPNPSTRTSLLKTQVKSSTSRLPIQLLKISYLVLYQFQKDHNDKNNIYRIQNYLRKNSLVGSIMMGINGYLGVNIDDIKKPNRRLLQDKKKNQNQNQQEYPVEYDPRKIADQKLFKIYSKVFDILQMQIINVRGMTPIATSNKGINQGSNNIDQLQQSVKEIIQKNRCISKQQCLMNQGVILPKKLQCAFCKRTFTFNLQCQQCQCSEGEFLNLTVCDPIPKCKPGYIFDKNDCVHVASMDQQCLLKNGVFNYTTKRCQCINGEFKKTFFSNMMCIPNCNKECEIYNITTKKCQAFCFIKNGKKVRCEKPYEVNQQKDKCVCMQKSIRGKNGNCIICPYGTLANLEKETCQEVDQQTFKRIKVNHPGDSLRNSIKI